MTTPSQRKNVLNEEYDSEDVIRELDHLHKTINELFTPFTTDVKKSLTLKFDQTRVCISNPAITITLPRLLKEDAGLRFYFKDRTGDATANPHTILPSPGKTIDGATSQSISADFDSLEVEWGGENWFKYNPT